jgi:glycosidase
MDQPEVHDAIKAMRQVAEGYNDRVLIGEAYLPIDRLMAYYGVDLTGFHLPFNFHLLSTPWRPKELAALVERYEAALPQGAWPNWVLGNHDRSRVASRIGLEQARVAAMLLLTLRGTPTIYQGEEIGMSDVPFLSNSTRTHGRRTYPVWGSAEIRSGPLCRGRRLRMAASATEYPGYPSAEILLRGTSRRRSPIQTRCCRSIGPFLRCGAPSTSWQWATTYRLRRPRAFLLMNAGKELGACSSPST